ncbi:hypothetical protein BN14_03618 [Rhizoctonia solani AG-1 IB]|uniref:Methyltransferase domain-containing protein n=2 Tax=Rhizoctonia solani TaxID=456999 RepID=A0A8H3AD15_9AGAM|nr:unnamed protein product [Rhizoctonia solani]CCO29601.1 hypothetical protein BN14_03618 [Rhizoctonia solani AG-1 IB]
MAAAFPHSDVLAIDLAPGIPENAPPNVQFKVADVTKEVPEYYDQFDLIQARCVANGIKDFEALVALVHHYLKPGGVFIIAEGRGTLKFVEKTWSS